MLYGQGKYEEAEIEHRRALALREQALGPDHPSVAQSRHNLAFALESQRKYEEAEAEYRRALALLEQALGDDHPVVAQSRNNLAGALYEQGKYKEALPLAEQAWTRRRLDDVPAGDRAWSAFVLSRILWSVAGPSRDRVRADQLARDALVSYQKAGTGHRENLAKVQQWLEDHTSVAIVSN